MNNTYTDFDENKIEKEDFVLSNGKWFVVDNIEHQSRVLWCSDEDGEDFGIFFNDVECVDCKLGIEL